MKGPMLASLIGAVLAAAVGFSQARADKIDDLLAGRSISEDATLSADERVAEPLVPHQSVVADDHHRLVEPTGLEMSNLSHGTHEELHVVDESEHRQNSGPTTTFSVVPEPSAIALAALALVYFFIFFRRRYAL